MLSTLHHTNATTKLYIIFLFLSSIHTQKYDYKLCLIKYLHNFYFFLLNSKKKLFKFNSFAQNSEEWEIIANALAD